MKSMKVYLGTLTMAMNPAHDITSIRVSLQRSGFRDPRTHELHFNVDYRQTHTHIKRELAELYRHLAKSYLERHEDATMEQVGRAVYARMPEDKLVLAGVDEFEIVIFTREIQTISPFDVRIFDDHFQRKDPGHPVW